LKIVLWQERWRRGHPGGADLFAGPPMGRSRMWQEVGFRRWGCHSLSSNGVE
jgi:hypothetical protein